MKPIYEIDKVSSNETIYEVDKESSNQAILNEKVDAAKSQE